MISPKHGLWVRSPGSSVLELVGTVACGGLGAPWRRPWEMGSPSANTKALLLHSSSTVVAVLGSDIGPLLCRCRWVTGVCYAQ